MMEKARERVARGAALLDDKRPGWAWRIRVDTLDMAHGARCILGQEYAQESSSPGLCGYEVGGTRLLGIGAVPKVAHGFLMGHDGVNYPTLQAAWLEAIAARTEALPEEVEGQVKMADVVEEFELAGV